MPVPDVAVGGPVDVLVLGAQKAGTTSLWAVLRRQDWFVPARLKELDHFSARSPVPDEVYRSWFGPKSHPSQLRGEATPGYLSAYPAPARIRAHNPDVKLIAVLRDPVDRARSAFHHARRIGKVDRRAALEDVYREEARRRVTERSWTRIRWDGMYARHLERYLEHFPREQLHVLFFEELVADPDGTLAGLWRFVGREGTVGAELPHRNRGRDARLPVVERTFAHLGRTQRARRWALAGRALRTVQRLQARELAPAPLAGEAVSQIVEDYAPEVDRLTALLGRRPPWPRFAGTATSSATGPELAGAL